MRFAQSANIKKQTANAKKLNAQKNATLAQPALQLRATPANRLWKIATVRKKNAKHPAMKTKFS